MQIRHFALLRFDAVLFRQQPLLLSAPPFSTFFPHPLDSPGSPDNNAYYSDRSDKCAGAFYGGDGSAVGANVVFILAVIAWVCATCMALFMAIKFTIGMRVDKEMEVSLAFCFCGGGVSTEVVHNRGSLQCHFVSYAMNKKTRFRRFRP